MSTTVVIWNVETYGSNITARGDYSGVNEYIIELMLFFEADVFVMEEFKPEGVRYLYDLPEKLQARTKEVWVADFIEGALAGTKPGYIKLGWGSNIEGYALIGKIDALNNMPKGLSNGIEVDFKNYKFMTLAEKGADPKIDPSSKYVISAPVNLPDDPSKTTVLGFPTSSTGAITPAPLKPSPRLDVDYAKRYEQQVAAVMQEEYARRPCIVSVKPEDNPTWIVTYHSPVADPASLYAAMLCGLTEHVVCKDSYERLVVGGDFNMVGADTRKLGFYNFKNFGLAALGGLDKKSTVHYDKGEAKILNHARDQIFARGCGNVMGGVFDKIVTDITDNQFNKAILNNAAIEAMVKANKPDGFTAASQAIYDKLVNCFTTKRFDSKVSAAMLFRGYISDHLPLTIEF